MNPENGQLVIEIGDASLGYDLGRKAIIYASCGVAEYWVLDVQARRTHVLSKPERDAYHEIIGVGFNQPLTPQRLPGLSLVIADLPGLKLD